MHLKRRGFVLMEGLIMIAILTAFLVILMKVGILGGGWWYILAVPGFLFFGLMGVVMVCSFCSWCYFAYKQFMWKRGWGPPPPPPCQSWL